MKSNTEQILDEYLDEILKINEKINLTRITDSKEAKLLHIEDSLSALEELEKAPEGLYGDIGSGGGFPGVPLAIATGRRTVLIDSVKKKMNAVQDVLNKMSLDSSITTKPIRIEELALEEPEVFSVLTARALSSLPSLLELASPLLMQNGHLICLKSHIEEEELNKSRSLQDKTGMELISKREFMLSDDETYRTILVFEKTSKPTIDLPRRNGLAQKKPLV